MDMARLFPHVKIYGVDIGELADRRISTVANYLSAVPIATRQPEPNVQFEIHDITQRFRWNDGAMDFIHARNIDLAVRLHQSHHCIHLIHWQWIYRLRIIQRSSKKWLACYVPAVSSFRARLVALSTLPTTSRLTPRIRRPMRGISTT